MIKDIVSEGYDSFFDGETLDMNPYKVGSIKYESWVNGYLNAKQGIWKRIRKIKGWICSSIY